jgi:hypothetical protein
MNWNDTESTLFAVVALIAGLTVYSALAAGVLVGVSKRLVGFRVPFMAASKAVAATVVVTMLLRGVGRAIDQAFGFGVGWAVALAGVIYFLAWYFDRYVQRPNGTALGRDYGYRLAFVYAVIMVVASTLAAVVIGTSL